MNRRSIALTLAVTLAVGSGARGADAGALAADAQQAAAAVDARLLEHLGELQQLARQLEKQADDVGDLARKLDEQREANKRLAPLIEKAADAARADLDAARRAFAEREAGVRAAQSALATAKASLAERRAAADRAAAEERAAFAASPEFVALKARVDAAAAEVARVEGELAAQEKLDVPTAKATAESNRLERDVVALRGKQPVDAAALADASAAWIAAKSKAETARRELYARHRPYVQANEALRDARAGVEARQAAFDRSILGRPGVAEAQLAAQEAAFAVKSADADVTAARREQDRAAAAVADRREHFEQSERLRKESAAKAADLRQDLTRMQTATLGTSRALTARVAEALSIRKDLGGVLGNLKLITLELAKAARDAGKKPR